MSAGALHFVFEDDPEAPLLVSAGDVVSIPPGRPHHVELDGPVRVVVEFYRDPDRRRGK